MSTFNVATISGQRSSRAINWGRVALVGLATVAAATLANTLVYLIGGALVDYHPDFLPIATVGGTLTFTVFFSTLAVLVYAAVLRFSSNPARHYTVIAAVALILSIVPDLTMLPGAEGSSSAQIAVLIVMHIVAAAVIVPMLSRLAAPARR